MLTAEVGLARGAVGNAIPFTHSCDWVSAVDTSNVPCESDAVARAFCASSARATQSIAPPSEVSHKSDAFAWDILCSTRVT